MPRRPDTPVKLALRKPPLHERDEKGRQAAFVPTDQHRRLVHAMASYGTPIDQIEKVLDISRPTLKKYFQRELDTGAPEANAQVAKALFNAAVKDKSVPAMIAWLNSRANWKQSARVEHTGADGAPIQSVAIVTDDPIEAARAYQRLMSE